MPDWLKNAVFYEIYPQSFKDTNGDGIGDIDGIIEKLGYIHELGCNALWINPCFESPFHDAGYDVSDYRKVAPRYGTNENLRRLFAEAHSLGIRVLLDLVPGHTAIDHEWFRRSSAGDPEFAGRYIWADNVWERFEGISGILGNLNGFSERGSCATNFYSTQPALNYGFAEVSKPWQSRVDSPEALATRDALKDVMRFWLQMGCDGFRVDMAHSLIKADAEQRETIRFWQYFRAFLDGEFPDAAIVSEWGDPQRSLAAGFHMDFLLHFGPTRYNDLFREKPFFSKTGGGDIYPFIKQYSEMLADIGDGLICIPSSNHDMARISRYLDEEDLKVAFAFLLSVPGAPFIYYGDEIGMRYQEGIPSVEGGFERTGSRSPMQWDETLNAGFSSARPEDLYIPLDPEPGRPDVKRQMADPASLRSEVRRLIELRTRHEALQNTAPVEFLPLRPGEDGTLIYRRGKGEGAITVALNPSGNSRALALHGLNSDKLLHYVGSHPEFGAGTVTLPPSSGAFFLEQPGGNQQ
jgi:maltose alpha-D-glucosyltransferase/alpha-amylase